MEYEKGQSVCSGSLSQNGKVSPTCPTPRHNGRVCFAHTARHVFMVVCCVCNPSKGTQSKANKKSEPCYFLLFLFCRGASNGNVLTLGIQCLTHYGASKAIVPGCSAGTELSHRQLQVFLLSGLFEKHNVPASSAGANCSTSAPQEICVLCWNKTVPRRLTRC